MSFADLTPEERDVRITALLLGELTLTEVEELRRIIAADSKLTRTLELRKRALDLVRETVVANEGVPDDAPKHLSAERREKLLAMFRAPAEVKPKRKRSLWFIPMTAAAGLIGLLVVMSVDQLSLGKAKARAQRVMPLAAFGGGMASVEDVDGERLWAKLKPNEPAVDRSTFAEATPADAKKLARPEVTTMSGGKAAVTAPDSRYVVDPLNPNSEVETALALGGTGYQPVPRGNLPRGTEGRPEQQLTFLPNSVFSPIPPGRWPGGTGRLPVPPISASEFGLNRTSDAEKLGDLEGLAQMPESEVLAKRVEEQLERQKEYAGFSAAANLEAKFRQRVPITSRRDPVSAVRPASPARLPQPNSYARTNVLISDRAEPDSLKRPATPPPTPQPEILTRDNAFSTFSLNVADVSFKLAAASLERGAMPEVANIRAEEFLNAFDYRDAVPPTGVAVGFTWERAQFPFAQNRDVLRFSVKTAAAGRDGGRPLNIVLLLDSSGSMERADRVRIIQEGLRTLATQLQAQDKISVVTFARTARLWVDGVSGTNAAEIARRVSEITPEGGTNLEDALDLAYRTAMRHYSANAINRVVLLTDGAANLGDVEPANLKAKVESNRKQGIALDCFGVGWEGFNDDLLEQLSRNGDGRYGFINSPEEAVTEFAGQLAGALRVAASDVKVQVEFNPKRVNAYRQIGYAKHQLTKEQFRDNKVDAAEIGASEAGHGLYVIETNPRGEGPIATVRVRYRIPTTSDYREQEWVVPFAPTTAIEQSGAAMKLAVTSAAFAESLASSPFATEVTSDRLLQILAGVPDTFGADPRPKKLEWMIRQAKAISGR